MSRPTLGSLFAGIGGLDLGLERAGWECRWQVEIDPYCTKVLEKYWPDVKRYVDITTVDWEDVERVDLVCGGFPCQPFSLAGKQLGADDPRYLWPEVVRCLRVLRPRRVLLENVPGLVTSPEFGVVLGDLASIGYDAEWDCIPAAAVGAPHLRYRLFIVAYPECEQLREQPVAFTGGGCETVARDDGTTRTVADTDSGGLEEHSEPHRGASGPGLETSRRHDAGGLRALLADTNGSSRSPARTTSEAVRGSAKEQRPRRRRGVLGDPASTPADALAACRRSWGPASESGWWAVEPDVGRVAHGVPHRVDRLRALGNAVVPQVAEFIGAQLLAHLGARAA